MAEGGGKLVRFSRYLITATCWSEYQKLNQAERKVSSVQLDSLDKSDPPSVEKHVVQKTMCRIQRVDLFLSAIFSHGLLI